MPDIAEVDGDDGRKGMGNVVDAEDVVASKGMSVVSEEPGDLRNSAFGARKQTVVGLTRDKSGISGVLSLSNVGVHGVTLPLYLRSNTTTADDGLSKFLS